jgi:hypothetical protein
MVSETRRKESLVTTTAIDDWRELASRGADGLAVSLLWSKATDQVRVTVADERFDEELDLEVPGAHALAAFYHPFAYAAVRGLGFGSALRASLDLQPQS